MKKTIFVVILLCILYFVIGFILMCIGWMKQNDYNFFASIVGGLASVCGLIGFLLPRLSTSDFQKIEVECLKSVAEKYQELEMTRKELNSKEKELVSLEVKKKEMEFLVRKASLSLFLQDQIERNEKKILEFIEANKEIGELMTEIKTLKEKLSALEEEIKTNENVDLLMEIIQTAKMKKQENQVEISFSSPFGSIFYGVDELAKAISNTLFIKKRR